MHMTVDAHIAGSAAPLISILVCTYNRAHVIGETLDTVLAQRYRPVEIVVVDDGSEDETPMVLDRYRDHIRYHRLPRNVGIARARTEACLLARGELIAFHDDDDPMPPDRLDLLWQALAGEPDAIFAVGDLETIDEQGRRTGSRWLPARADGPGTPELIEDAYSGVLWPTLPVVPHTTLFRRRDGERIGWFDEAFRHASEDKDFFARLGCLGPAVHVPQVVSLVRRGHASLTRNTVRTEMAALKLYRKHMALIADDPRRRPLYQRLQERISIALERIDVAVAEAPESADLMPAGHRERYLSLLPGRLRFRYFWRSRLRQPARRLLRRQPQA